MTTPVPPPDGAPGSEGNDKLPPMPPNFYAGAAAVNPNDPWYVYAQKMFPNVEITPDIIAGLKKNMMAMINNTIQQINARQAIAQEYNAKVAKGEG
jgi:hypothetical protein